MRLFAKLDGLTNTRFDRAAYLTPPFDLVLAIQYPNQPGDAIRREDGVAATPVRRSASEISGVLFRSASGTGSTLKRG